MNRLQKKTERQENENIQKNSTGRRTKQKRNNQ